MGQPGVILLDTHVVVWLAFEGERVSAKAMEAIRSARTSAEGLAISDISLLEIANLLSKGRLRIGSGMESFLQEVESRFVVLRISGRSCARAMELPPSYPKDPADRIIAATALVEGIALITADQEIRRSRVVTTIW